MESDNEPSVNKKSVHRHDGRKILLGSLLLLIWSIAYAIIVLGEPVAQATILSLNTVSNLISDTLIIIGLGLILVSFFILSDFFIRLSVDRRAFVKLEQCYFNYKRERKFSTFLSDFIHFDQVEADENPIPVSENFALIFLGIYYIINFIGFSVITEILFFTISAGGQELILGDSTSTVVYILPILASSLVIGGKVASLYYKYAKEYAQMLTETLFIFLLFGILASLYGQHLPTFQDIIPGEAVVPIYISILAYLALIPVALEIVKWLLWMKNEDNKRKQSEREESKKLASVEENEDPSKIE